MMFIMLLVAVGQKEATEGKTKYAQSGLYAGFTSSGSYIPVVGYMNRINLPPAEVSVESEEKEVVSEAIDVEEPLYSQDDYENLAKLVYAEAGNQGRKCMMYVGSVILNRISNGHSWQCGDTVYEVWSRKGQYPGTFARRNYIKPSDEAYSVAEELLTNGSILPPNVLCQHGGGVPVEGTEVYEEVNGEVFSYD